MSLLGTLIDIGRDRYIDRAELPAGAAIDLAWEVYREHFDGFTGATLDPQYNRLHHPALWRGNLRLPAGASVLVVGAGRSLTRGIAALRQVRGAIVIFTSPRGAEALASQDISPDLIIVEHQSPLDALISVERRAHNTTAPRCHAALVAAESRTPAPLLDTLGDRLFIPAAPGVWGQWAATAVTWAAMAGAGRIGLLGVDLGDEDAVAPEYVGLAALLTLLAATTDAVCIDCGIGTASKPGWPKGPLRELAGGARPGLIAQRHPLGPTEFFDNAERWRDACRPVVAAARDALADAIALRDGRTRDPRPVWSAARLMLSWRENPQLRHGFQDELGLSFLPRLWRTGIHTRHDSRIWRPVILALHELVAQTNQLDMLIETRHRHPVSHV